MKTSPSTRLHFDIPADVHSLAELGVGIDNDGFGPHEPAVAELVAVVEAAGLDLPPVDVLADRSGPEVVRSRAFAALVSDWPRVRQALQAGFDDSLDRLLRTWVEHEDLRRSGAGVAALAASRSRLDTDRRASARHRRNLTSRPRPAAPTGSGDSRPVG